MTATNISAANKKADEDSLIKYYALIFLRREVEELKKLAVKEPLKWN